MRSIPSPRGSIEVLSSPSLNARLPSQVRPSKGLSMPEQDVIQRARRDAEEGKSPSTQAGEFVREEIEHVREGKHGARSPQQAIAIGLSKARRAGIKLPPPKKGRSSQRVRRQAERDLSKGRSRRRKSSAKRSRATSNALRRESRRSVSHAALSRQGRSSARRRGSAGLRRAARAAVRAKGRTGRQKAAAKAARTRHRPG
jgi:hypothetical protein